MFSRLPNLAEFEGVKQYPNTFVLAPGFQVGFSGNLYTDNGMVAAERLIFGGTAGGRFTGTLLSLGEYPADIGGTPDIGIDIPDDETNPDGFAPTFKLEEDPYTYTEGWNVSYGQVTYGEGF